MKPGVALACRGLLGVGLLLSLAGCGGSGSPSSSSGGVPILLLLSADGPFSVTFQGQTFTAEGPYNLTLKPGAYEISGRMQTTGLSIDFSRVMGTGGVQAGSVRNLAGPAVNISQCGVFYLTYTPPANIRMQFTVTESSGSACN